MEAVTVGVIQGETAFEALRDEWNRLLLRSKTPSVFLSHEWMHLYWKYFKADRELMILTARGADDGLIGVAPLCVRKRSLLGVPAFRRAEFLGSPFTDVLDVLVEPGREAHVLSAFVDELVSRNIDMVVLEELPESSPAREALSVVRAARRIDVAEEAMTVLPYVTTLGGWSVYLSALGKSTQRHFKYYTNRLSKQYRLTFEAHTDPDAVEKNLGPFLDLYHKRFSDYPVMVSPSYRRFREDVARWSVKNGWMVLFTLKLDGHLVAAEWCFRWNGALLSYNACYDPDRSKEGTTTVLQGNVIRYAMENGFREYDFLRGAEGYKAHWTSLQRSHYRVRIRRPTLRLALLEAGRRIYNGRGTGDSVPVSHAGGGDAT